MNAPRVIRTWRCDELVVFVDGAEIFRTESIHKLAEKFELMTETMRKKAVVKLITRRFQELESETSNFYPNEEVETVPLKDQ